jgi:hypothetical protein
MSFFTVLFLITVFSAIPSSAQTMRDRNNMKIGSIGKDGTVRDRNNMKIGTANGVNMYHTAVFYFFNLL